MKKVIKGKLYDTDKARRLGFDGQGDGFSRWYEELYQKRTGEFFLYGEGGPMTRYAVSVRDNEWCGGEKIIPLSVDKARAWAEEHLDADAYAAIFGLPDDDAQPVTLNINLPAALMARVRANAAERGMSVTAYLTEVLDATV